MRIFFLGRRDVNVLALMRLKREGKEGGREGERGREGGKREGETDMKTQPEGAALTENSSSPSSVFSVRHTLHVSGGVGGASNVSLAVNICARDGRFLT